MRDFAIELTDRPGELGRVAAALSRYGVNLKAVTGLGIDHHVLVRIIADDVEAARSALQGAGIRFTEGEVVQVMLENRAGDPPLMIGRCFCRGRGSWRRPSNW